MGKDDAVHLLNLRMFLQRFRERGIRLKRTNCALFQDEMNLLGVVIDRHGKRPSPQKITVVFDILKPRNVHELRSFLGIVNYFVSFIPNLSELTAPLNHLLQKQVH